MQQVHDLALSMPGVTVEQAGKNPVYQVSRQSFVFFRNPRPDAFDPETGERYDDVIVFWVADDADKQALVEDESTPFFTTPHFDGHPSVLLRGSRVGELDRRRAGRGRVRRVAGAGGQAGPGRLARRATGDWSDGSKSAPVKHRHRPAVNISSAAAGRWRTRHGPNAPVATDPAPAGGYRHGASGGWG